MSLTKQSYSNLIFLIGLGVFIPSFLFSIALNSILLGFVALLFLLDYKNIKTNLAIYLKQSRNILLLITLASFALSLVYTANVKEGLNDLVKYIPLLSIPLCLTRVHTIEKGKIELLKKIHIISCFAAALYCLMGAAIDSELFTGGYVNKVAPELYVGWFAHRFTYHQLSGQLHLHAMYMSLFIVMAIIFLLPFCKGRSPNNIFARLLLLFFIFFLLLLKSTSIHFALYSFLLITAWLSFSFRNWRDHLNFYGLAIVATALITYQFLLKQVGSFDQNVYLFETYALNIKLLKALALGLAGACLLAVFKRLAGRKNALVIVLIVLATGMVVSAPFVYGRINRALGQSGHQEGVTNVQARFGNWIGALKIVQDHPLTGAGIGDRDSVLIQKYKEIGFDTGVKYEFNAHNQYLDFWITSGILAVLCFVALLITELFKAFKMENYSYAALLYCFGIMCLTESAMRIQSGRIFFLFFMCVLGHYMIPVPKQSIKTDPIH